MRMTLSILKTFSVCVWRYDVCVGDVNRSLIFLNVCMHFLVLLIQNKGVIYDIFFLL